MSVELTSRCSCYVFRQYFAVKRVQCPPNSSPILFKQPKQLNLVPRFPRSTVQYDGSIWRHWRHRFNMTVWFYPIRNGEIFWMNNKTTYWITKNDKAAHMLHVYSLEKHTFLASSEWRFKQIRLSASLVLIVEIIEWKPSSYAPYKNPALETSLSIFQHLCFWECQARISRYIVIFACTINGFVVGHHWFYPRRHEIPLLWRRELVWCRQRNMRVSTSHWLLAGRLRRYYITGLRERFLVALHTPLVERQTVQHHYANHWRSLG